MKNLFILLIPFLSLNIQAQTNDYDVSSYLLEGVKEGDILKCTANTEHWHSSSKHQDVTYLAIYKGETEWTEVLTREVYDEVSLLLSDK